MPSQRSNPRPATAPSEPAAADLAEPQKMAPEQLASLELKWKADPTNRAVGLQLMQRLPDSSPKHSLLIQIVRQLALSAEGTLPELNAIADRLLKLNLADEAAAFLQNATLARPHSAPLFHSLGELLCGLQRNDEALAALRRAIQLAPYSDSSMTLAGVALMRLGRASEALEYFGAAVRINSESELAFSQMGNALCVLGEINGAVSALQRALEISPESQETRSSLSSALMRAQRHKEAIPHLEHLARTRGGTEADLARLCIALHESRLPLEAIQLAEDLVRRFPKNPAHRLLLQTCLTGSSGLREYDAAPPSIQGEQNPLPKNGAEALRFSEGAQPITGRQAPEDRHPPGTQPKAEYTAPAPFNLSKTIVDIANKALPSEWIEATLELLRKQPDLRRELVHVAKLCLVQNHELNQLALCGELLQRLGDFEEAAECFIFFRASAKTAAEWTVLGKVFQRCQLPERAMEALEKACSLPDAKADALLALSTLVENRGDHEKAQVLCRQVISLNPSLWGAYHNLACYLLEAGQFGEALKIAEVAVRFSQSPAVLLNLSVCQTMGGQPANAIRTLKKLLEQEPDNARAHLNLGNCLLSIGQLSPSLDAFRKAVSLQPREPLFLSSYLHALNYLPEISRQQVFDLQRSYAKQFESPLLPHPPHANSKDPARRLRMAYLSPDFRNHSVAYFIEPILRAHDRGQFEVFGIQTGLWTDDKTARLKSLCEGWIEAGNLSDEALADHLRSLQFDILVDLASHSQGTRMMTFARKPAPLQLTMIGMHQSSGLSSMDYRVTDSTMDPPGESGAFDSEKLLRLERAFVFTPPPGAPEVAPLPARKNGYITFGSFNNFSKIHPGVVAAWAEILRHVPDSKLLVILPDGTDFERAMAAHGIAPDRLRPCPRLPTDAYLRLHHEVDMALDCFPFAGLTVSAIAAWMGVPTLTIAGESPCARAGASLQESLGLGEFIASNPGGFVRKAVELASDLRHLGEVRETLRHRASLQLTNAQKYTREFERALREVWSEWCNQCAAPEPSMQKAPPSTHRPLPLTSPNAV